jgi:hypothetical protein
MLPKTWLRFRGNVWFIIYFSCARWDPARDIMRVSTCTRKYTCLENLKADRRSHEHVLFQHAKTDTQQTF